ncbi:MAG: 4-hydroxythreonine-4-phosphate dehydrogenase PdxA [Gammaproteobacteria bacterium]|nr:4-hydroxythreonine-4-phosphate dehydrogenase PdxA [Gammaproteobacteria bacterium]
MSKCAERNKLLPTIAVTPGEPAGIGPDIALLLGARNLPAKVAWIANPELLAQRAQRLGLAATVAPFDPATRAHRAGHFGVIALPLATPSTAGTLAAENSRYVLACLDRAIAGCLSGEFDAMVTGPVHKAIINEAGVPFSGHTEYLAAAAGGVKTVMMLATPKLRVALVTTHIPLSQVPECITQRSVSFAIGVVAEALKTQFGVARPRLSVCGLNPHAGEGGHLGGEEIAHIEPAIAWARAAGIAVQGPLPADTAFTPHALARADAVLAMYHDQGLAALKALGFGDAVNVTLGLPFIRTSVDHGTALDLAGSGLASAASLTAAFRLALRLVTQRAARTHSP